MASTKVNLISQEGDSFEVDKKTIVYLSDVVRNVVTDNADKTEALDIPIANVKSNILGLVIKFCHHYTTDPLKSIPKVRSSPTLSQRERERERQRL